MQRLRLKADGRIVELRDGQEFPLAPTMPGLALAMPGLRCDARARRDASSAAKPGACRPCATFAAARSLTQIEFAARLGVPVETIRNWEQGKRAPRGPARALLAVIAHSPETVFAALATGTVAGLSVMVDVSLTRTGMHAGSALENAICWHGRFRSP